MAKTPALAIEQLPDGVFLGMDEAIYFAQDRLGSSDLQRLYKHKEGWWWASRHNPDRRDQQTEAQNYGSALHALMLEGLAVYEKRFAVEPDKNDYERLLFTIPQIKEALEEEGFSLEKTSSWKLPDWASAAELHIPHIPVWANVMADFESELGPADDPDRPRVISALEDRALRTMYEAALENPEVRELLGVSADFPTLAEVSVFWTDRRGVKRRARFDKPVPRFTLDLKSLGNWQGRELKHGVGDVILNGGLDIQVGDQHVARTRAYQMVLEDEGNLHGGTEEERTWFMAMANRAPWMPRGLQWEWVWLFYQKPELSGRAAIIFPVWENWRGRFHLSGYRKSVQAIDTYLDGIRRFGLGDIPAEDGTDARPWSRVEPVHYTEEEAPNHISLPHYGWAEDTPAPGEDDPELFPL